MAERTEKSHAIIPKYRQGQLIPDNKAELSLPLHAFHHLLVAESVTSRRDIEANYWAVRAIVKRMTPEEEKEYLRLAALHHKNGI